METRVITRCIGLKLHGAKVDRIEANRIHVCTEVVLTLSIKGVRVQQTNLLAEMPDKIRHLVNAAFSE
jgi:hypothetical protein